MRVLDARKILREKGIRPRKSLGQNFLVSPRGLRAILEAAELRDSDVVVEIGAGIGTLTVPLAERVGKVIAVEIDRRLVEILEEICAGYPNVLLVQGDVLDFSLRQLLEQGGCPQGPCKAVGNLPYYVTSAILRHFLENTPRPSLMVVTVQKEVAQRMAASPGEMSLLSVSVQFYSKPRIVCHLPAGAFYPPPEVDSAVVKLEVLPEPRLPPEEEQVFFRIVRAGFGERRKTLRNSLSRGLNLPVTQVEEALAAASIDPQRRAESLSVEEWLALYEKLRVNLYAHQRFSK
ncbi:MAG: ribosomal RNA small subunit methyltransferase A [Chloroflexi bacterium]|nr:MAG: ribosomal RNA small subunit methyltransferase A [Chloroflexota bacterium]